MAYETTNPPNMLMQLPGGTKMWLYVDGDGHGTVDGSGYFTNGAALGMAANDVMIVVDTATPTCTLHHVASATTITAATLA